VLIALDPTAAPGLAVNDGASLAVNGRILVNSPASPAATVNGGQVLAADYQVAGPTVSGGFHAYPGTPGRLALAHAPAADPLIHLPTPAATTGPANNTANPFTSAWSGLMLGSPSVSDQGATGLVPPNAVDGRGTVQLVPGIYGSIAVTGGRVNLGPGIYILSPPNGQSYALDVTGGTVTGTGVMFYNTGGDFVPSTGYPDYNDAGLYDPGPSGINAPSASGDFQGRFAGIRLDASNNNTVQLSPMTSDGGP
jgi:hypothetical protein